MKCRNCCVLHECQLKIASRRSSIRNFHFVCAIIINHLKTSSYRWPFSITSCWQTECVPGAWVCACECIASPCFWIPLIYYLIECKVESRSKSATRWLFQRWWSSKWKLCHVHMAATQKTSHTEMLSFFCRWNREFLHRTHIYISQPMFARLVRCSLYLREQINFHAVLLIWKMCQKQLPVSLSRIFAFEKLFVLSTSQPGVDADVRCDVKQRSRPNIRMQSETEREMEWK